MPRPLFRINFVFILPSFALAYVKPMVMDGLVSDTDLIANLGSSYQAIRYEPLYGTLGSNAPFQSLMSLGGYCSPAMDVFSNNIHDSLAFYDITGQRLKNAVMRAGTVLCMCFALSQGGTNGIKGGICIWIDRAAQAAGWWNLMLDDVPAGDHRPGTYKSLPQYAAADLDAMDASWSATTVQHFRT